MGAGSVEHAFDAPALIGDPRNDENLFISQLQLAFLKFHNRVVDELGEFEPARSAVVDVYHAVLAEAFCRG